jgi:general secretion pathway protein J
MNRRYRAEGGFTLLELLVAMALLGFIALSLAGGLRFGVAAWHRVQARSDEAELAVGLHDALERMIGQTQASYASDDPADLALTFAGEPSRLSLTAPLPDVIEPGILAIQRLFLRGSALTLSWRLDLPGADRQPEQVAVLAHDVQFVRLQYWGVAQPGTRPAWYETWQNQPRLPGLVRVEIGRHDVRTLAYTIAVRSTVSATCRYDPVGPACRRGP